MFYVHCIPIPIGIPIEISYIGNDAFRFNLLFKMHVTCDFSLKKLKPHHTIKVQLYLYNVEVTQLCTEGRRRGEMLLRRAASVTFLTRFCTSVYNHAIKIYCASHIWSHISELPKVSCTCKKAKWSQQVNNM